MVYFLTAALTTLGEQTGTREALAALPARTSQLPKVQYRKGDRDFDMDIVEKRQTDPTPKSWYLPAPTH